MLVESSRSFSVVRRLPALPSATHNNHHSESQKAACEQDSTEGHGSGERVRIDLRHSITTHDTGFECELKGPSSGRISIVANASDLQQLGTAPLHSFLGAT